MRKEYKVGKIIKGITIKNSMYRQVRYLNYPVRTDAIFK
jgi:hypothetical protein